VDLIAAAAWPLQIYNSTHVPAALFWLALAAPVLARDPLAARIAHNDPAKYHHDSAHDGAGSLDFIALFGASDLNTNLQFLHRGVIPPKSGIGEHFHTSARRCLSSLNGELSSRSMAARRR